MVTEVDEVLPLLQGLLADGGQRHHRLDAAAVAGLQAREAQLPGVAAEDDATGDGRGDARLRAGLQVAEAGAQLRDRVGDRHGHGIGATRGIRTLGDETLALGEPHGLLLEDVLLGPHAISRQRRRVAWSLAGAWAHLRGRRRTRASSVIGAGLLGRSAPKSIGAPLSGPRACRRNQPM